MYQPFAPRVPAVIERFAVGLDLSSFTVRGAASVYRPAALMHDPLTGVPEVSVVNVCVAEQTTPPLTASLPEASMVTSSVYQPLLPGVPLVTARLADGPVLSTLTVTASVGVDKPAALVQEAL